MLDYKDYYLLGILKNSNQPLSVNDISSLLGISRRSVYYSLGKINDYLKGEGYDEIENVRDFGLVIKKETRSFLNDNLDKKVNDQYIHTQKERVVLETLIVLASQENIGIAYFESLFEVSRNSIVGDIKLLKQELRNVQLELEFEIKRGYYVSGEPVKVRRYMLYLLSSYHYLIKMNYYGLYDETDYLKIYDAMRNIQSHLKVRYVEETKVIFAKYLAIIKKSQSEAIVFLEEDQRMIRETDEYAAVKNALKGMFETLELDHIALNLMGLRIHVHDSLISKNDEEIHRIVRFLMDEFKKFTLIDFEDEKTLYEGLYQHMSSAIIRYTYGIIYDNEIKKDVEEKYRGLYHIVKHVAKKLEALLGVPIPDDDVAYLAVHFGGHLVREEKQITVPKVLLVCLNGIATSKLLRRELESIVSNIQIIDAVSLDQVSLFADDVDYIVTTIPLKEQTYQDKTLMVSAIPTALDIKRLNALLKPVQAGFNIHEFKAQVLTDLKQRFKEQAVIDEVVQIIEHNIAKFYENNIELERFDQKMLNELISKDHIKFLPRVKDYKEALYEGGRVLIEKGLIEARYIEKVVENMATMGPYIVVAPLVAISHARPEDGVNALGMSLLMLEEPVEFSSEKERPVRVIITLAAPDNESHLKALGQLSDMLMNEMDAFLEAKTQEDILNLIEKYSK